VDSEATPVSEERAAAAADVALVYANDGEPGISRRRSGTGFDYRWPDGRQVREPEVLERIGGLVIPPAWTEVWVAPNPDFHLQVTGKDVRGRKQYRYHERWTACRDEVKFSNLVEFARGLPRLRRAVEDDLGRRGLVREKVVATVVRLLDATMIRVGNAAYARENGSFGLTTFRDRHVRVEGSSLRFRFKGKSGKEWRLQVTDRRIARIVKQTQDLPGQQLFQYLDEEGEKRRVSSNDVNAYIRAAMEGPFSSKHFRTWGGTVQALALFSGIETPETKRGLAAATNEVIDAVSRQLGNTRTVCRRCYIHPLVLARWEEGRLAEEVAEVRRRFRRGPAGLDRAECVALRWLETAGEAVPAAEPALCRHVPAGRAKGAGDGRDDDRP
jgi:DNA topoisomerase-1